MNVRAIDAETDMNSGRISSKLTRKLTWAEPAELLCIGLSRGMAAEQANSHVGICYDEGTWKGIGIGDLPNDR